MARLLVLDWDQDRCHILLGNVARSGLKIERAAVWAQDEIFNLAQGEAAGKKLKDFLKNAGMPPAPVLICLPKQRILVKELRVPSVAVGDEPALVRFQAAKELLENLDDLVLDYAHLSRSTTESQILATAVRKDLFAGYTSLAKAAGLKLLAVTPRPFVLADLLARCRKIDPVPSSPPPEWSAVLLLGQSWAELTILHGQTVCFARSMANDGAIDSEVRRSLVMFATQVQGHAPQILYLFGQTATSQAQESLARTLQIPVTRPKVLADDDLSAGGVEYSSGIGLLTAWSGEKIAVNFVKPKEPKPPPPSNHRLWLLAAGGGVVMLMFFFLLTQQMLARTKDLIAQNKQEKESVDKKLKSFEQERIDLEAFEDWEQGSISWIDEIFELSKRFPYEPAGFHLTRLDANVSSRKNVKDLKEKEKLGHVVVSGVSPRSGQRESFQEALHDDHLLLGPERTDLEKKTFTFTIDLARQPAKNFQSQLDSPDKELSKLYAGKWLIEDKKDGFAMKGYMNAKLEGKQDGTWQSESKIDLGAGDNKKSMELKLSGKWKIRDGVLEKRIDTSTMPQFSKIGSVDRFAILALDGKVLRTRELSKGKEKEDSWQRATD